MAANNIQTEQIIKFRIDNISEIKYLFETACKLCGDQAYLGFSSNSHMSINLTNNDKTTSVLIKIYDEYFGEFYSKYKKHEIKINLQDMYDFLKIKNVVSNFTMSLNSKNIINLGGYDPELKKVSRTLKPLNSDDGVIFPAEFPVNAYFAIDTKNFNQIISDFSKYSDHIKIKCIKNELIFASYGCDETKTLRLHGAEIGSPGSMYDTCGVYNLKHLNCLEQCNNHFENTVLFFNHDFSMAVRYFGEVWGNMIVIFAPTLCA